MSKPKPQLINVFQKFRFRFKDSMEKSKQRILKEQEKLRRLSGESNPQIEKYIAKKYSMYLDINFAPPIPIKCPHCYNKVILSAYCRVCGWKLRVNFPGPRRSGWLMATPTVKSPIRFGESILYELKMHGCDNYKMRQLYDDYQNSRQHHQSIEQKNRKGQYYSPDRAYYLPKPSRYKNLEENKKRHNVYVVRNGDNYRFYPQSKGFLKENPEENPEQKIKLKKFSRRPSASYVNPHTRKQTARSISDIMKPSNGISNISDPTSLEDNSNHNES